MQFRIFDLLLPRETQFYAYMHQLADVLIEGTVFFKDFIGRFDNLSETDIHFNITKIKDYELKGDAVERKIIDELHKTFITPLDREDIFMISLYIDDILDYCYSTVEEMQLLGTEADEYLMKMVTLTREATEELEMAFHTISTNPRVAGEHARRAKKIENEVEHLYRVAIGDLFVKAKDFEPLMVMLRRREVYRHVSNMADQADKAADILGMVVMKLT